MADQQCVAVDFHQRLLSRQSVASGEEVPRASSKAAASKATFITKSRWTYASLDLALMADQPDVAEAALPHVMDRWSRDHGFHVQHWYRWIGEVETALYRGPPDIAWQRGRGGPG